MLLNILAHAGEDHGSAAESAVHQLAWYVQIPIFFLVLVAVATLIWLITKKLDLVILICSFLMLVTGFLVFQVAPIVSIIAITMGLIATLALTLIGLGRPAAKK